MILIIIAEINITEGDNNCNSDSNTQNKKDSSDDYNNNIDIDNNNFFLISVGRNGS